MSMLPVDAFEAVAGELKPGSIVIAASKGLEEPRLVYSYEGKVFALALAGDAKLRFTTCVGEAVSGTPSLLISKPRLEVDPTSALTGFSGMPSAGAVFVDDGGAGFIGTHNHATIYVRLSGEMLTSDPSWGVAVTFSKWRIVVDRPAPAEPFVIAEGPSSAYSITGLLG